MKKPLCFGERTKPRSYGLKLERKCCKLTIDNIGLALIVFGKMKSVRKGAKKLAAGEG